MKAGIRLKKGVISFFFKKNFQDQTGSRKE